MADCQFADIESPPNGRRRYLRSPQKLADAVATLAAEKPHLAIHLGDLIDRDFKSFGVVAPILAGAFARPVVHVAGNHDFAVADADKPRVRATLGIPENGRREIVAPGWRFLFLDSNELSVHRHAAGSPEARAAEAYRQKLLADPAAAPYAQTYNGGLGEAQRAWLRERLEAATREHARVIVFCHQPLPPHGAHALWDARETAALLAVFPCAVAWINGHNHDGDYERLGALHCLNLKGMVDTTENTFALATLFPDRLEIRGYGREPSRTLKFD